MASYNKIEKKIADYLKKNPSLKRTIKKTYQYFSYLFYKKKKKVVCNYDVVPINNDEHESYFGYYDKNPYKNGRVLYQEIEGNSYEIPLKKILKEEFIYIVIKENNDIIYKNKTYAFNWQQGSKPQWISDNQIVYNNIIDGKTRAVIYSINDRKEVILEYPIYDSFKNLFYLSINYEVLSSLRPDYGYFKKNGWNNTNYYQQSIIYCEYNKKPYSLIKIDDINKKFPIHENISYEKQKLNHIMISPDGKLFLFLHRFYGAKNERNDRLFIASMKKMPDTNLALLNNTKMVSHYCWIDSNSFIVYMNFNNLTGYYIVNINDNLELKIEKLDIPNLDKYGDGHPTYIGDNKFITDTYPDKSRNKHLLLVDIDNNKVDVLGSFWEPLKYYEESRCDLHPKWDKDNKCIYIDSVHTGKRKLYKIGPIIIG
ncbi:hypothetical protein [Xenorhabdus sp. IM139775]|uniref:hypothetical protein n=1 Tax=Xenorhabdus sp. IM139775 TaxID=3025876 RepID=UPI00235935BD|nr:hypothetical protein [Xenorhabdus sp. IM139775]MDC9592796.1 hypothetical protein [Xenorhabdus sp. IM139775]